MSVFRVAKTKNYTVMSNQHLKDKNLSFKAKGLLSYMLSLPDTWDYSLEGLCKASKDNLTSVRNCLKELKENGYLQITKERNEKGHFEWIYSIFENKQPSIGFLYMDKPYMDNHMQINTNKVNTKKRKSKKKSFEPNYNSVTDTNFNDLYEN